MNKSIQVFSCVLIFSILGCGVKGLPTPPERPPSLGRGQPTFKDAVKGVQPAVIDPLEKEKKEEKAKQKGAKDE